MGVQEIRPSQVVGTEVKNIRRLKGRKKEIDDKLEYFRLGELLQDILKGKYDKNTVEKDANYIRGLQIEYEDKYGKPADEDNFNEPQQLNPFTNNSSALDKTTSNNNSGENSKSKDKEDSKDNTQVKITNKTKNSHNNNSDNDGVIVNGDNNNISVEEKQ